MLCSALALSACGAPGPTSLLSRQARPQPAARGGDFALQPASYTAEAARDAPIALTTADGNPLRLQWVRSRSVVEGPLAFTELQLGFFNPDERTIQGRFRIALPEGASLSRFAMKIGSEWQEGEVVERRRAQQIYEDFLHRKVDPALLEQGAGNVFEARVFPIAPRASKELVLSYSQELTGEQQALVPLAGLPELERLDATITTPDRAEPLAQIVKASYRPGSDLQLDRRLRPSQGLRHGNLLVARVAPLLTEAKPHPIRSALVLVDTSASRSLDLGRQLALVRRLAARLASSGGGSAKLAVACFDQTLEVIYRGSPGGLGQEHLSRIERRRALGATDLRAALAQAGAIAKAEQLDRVIMLTDGVVTAGEDGPAMQKTVLGLEPQGVQRLDVVAFGGIRDSEALRAMVTAGLRQDGVVLDGLLAEAEIWRRLSLTTKSGIAVKVAGARFWWPKIIDGIQPGDEVLVYADVASSASGEITLDGHQVGGLSYAQATRPLLERSFARAKIASLLEAERWEGKSDSLREQIVKLSTRHRVLSPYTALLVLETQADYDRYQLAREALADILTVDDQGRLTVRQRNVPPAPSKALTPQIAARPRAAGEEGQMWGADDSLGNDPLSARGNMWGDEIGEAFGAGGLGLTGIGEGGGGRGEGIGLGDVGTIGHGASAPEAAQFGMVGLLDEPPAAPPPPAAQAPPSAGAGTGTGQGFGSGQGRLGRSHRARPPQVRMGATTVSGRLPPEVIQRIVRQNFGRFRACYQNGLLRDPQLTGRLSVRFIISRDGSVAQVSTGGSLPDARVAACVARSFYALRFPQPEGGIITVSYPIMFSSEDGPAAPQQQGPRPTQPERLTAQPPPEPPEELTPVPRPTGPRQPEVASPYRGQLASVMDALAEGRVQHALDDAQAWQAREPGEVLALVALGEALEAAGQPAWAARAYGSIIDLFPSRADLRRFAGERLERVEHGGALELALDTYRKAKEQRPDHPTSHRLLAFALLKRGQHSEAFEALVAGREAARTARSRGAEPILRADLGIVAAAWLKAEPQKREHIVSRLAQAGAKLATGPSLRFVLNWETDVNDVDLHIYDMDGGHASYQEHTLRSGGRLFGDVTTGYGPELFEIEGEARSKGYFLQAHYYSRGPMGYGMGKVQIIEHDGKGGLVFDERPFVVMVDRAYVDLGPVGDWQGKAG